MAAKADLLDLQPNERTNHLGDRIARLAAQMTAGEHALVHAIADFDAAGGYVEDGALTTVQWLGWRIGMGTLAASERLRTGRALKELPFIDAAFAQAWVSYSKVRAMTRVATPENEADLLELGKNATAAQLEKICRKYRSVTCEATAIDAKLERFVRVQQQANGSTRITVQLPPDEAARVLAAIDAAKTELEATTELSAERSPKTEDRPSPADAPSPEPETPTDLSAESAPKPKDRLSRADAVVALAESYFASGVRPRRGGAPHEVVVHVDAAGLCRSSAEDPEPIGHIENAAGQGIGPETARRLCCDASVSPLHLGEAGEMLDVGRRSRTVPAPMRRALEARAEHTCQFPGCTHRYYLDAHHVEHWAKGGQTKLDNLVLLCRRHHVHVHELGWTVRIDAAGKPTFTSPRGDILQPHPQRPLVDLTPYPEAADRPELDSLGLAAQDSHGGPADYHQIIYVMMQRYGEGGTRVEQSPTRGGEEWNTVTCGGYQTC